MFREYVPDKPGIFLPPIEIQEHPQKGYICVAAVDIASGTLIERCPTIKFAAKVLLELEQLFGGRTVLHDYNFGYNKAGFSYFAMGYGGIYSHANEPNARWYIEHHANGRETVNIKAIKNIAKGEEITHRYVSLNSLDLLWFDPVD